MLKHMIKFFLFNKVITGISLLLIVVLGLMVTPFDIDLMGLTRYPVAVDAIPDIGDNQQIIFTEWPGRSAQDVEDQITYPLSVALQGVAGVKDIRSTSSFGFSTIHIIFKDNIDFYWSRSRVLERLSIAKFDLPDSVSPSLGPDANGLGQIFWYTLEGEGFGLEELRSIQDWYVKYALQATEGVSEVASVGGFIKEYQIDIDPDAMRMMDVQLDDIIHAVKKANVDVGAKTIEVNRVEYVVRGVGFIKTLADLESVVVKVNDDVPVYLRHVAQIGLGPALRRGALNKNGIEAVGGVVVMRYGENPKTVIKRVKKKIQMLTAGLPSKMFDNGRVSKVSIVPFYDRTRLVDETLMTLSDALIEEILITIIVILLFLMHLRSSLIVSLTLPITVLMTFILMKIFQVEANVMSLAGIAIAIGTVVDMGIIMCENILRRLKEKPPEKSRIITTYQAATEVGGAILTTIATTVVSFAAVFTMVGPEGKLFRPLAFSKTFSLIASVLVALCVVPALAHLFFVKPRMKKRLGLSFFSEKLRQSFMKNMLWFLAFIGLMVLAKYWLPLGLETGYVINFIFVALFMASVIFVLFKFMAVYPKLLLICLRYKKTFLVLPVTLFFIGLCVWLGFSTVMHPLTTMLTKVGVSESSLYRAWPFDVFDRNFPGLGKEFMPDFDEGAYLYMPTTMPHASIGEALDVLEKQNILIHQIPEVSSVVGKIGRVDSALDPAPISMIETVVNYHPEFGVKDESSGQRQRLWRDHIHSPDDIWHEITKVSSIPGTTSAPKLQPIAARLVMLQSGIRAPMGVKILGQSLADIEALGFAIERILKQVPGVNSSAVIADRIVAKPYLEFHIDREKIARYGVNIRDVQNIIETGIGGMTLTTTVEGRERYAVRVRYLRELRDSMENLEQLSLPTSSGGYIPLSQVAELEFRRGPQSIKSENLFLVGYVLFDKEDGFAEMDVVRAAQTFLQNKIDSGDLSVPSGVSFLFTGNYENQIRSEKNLAFILPLSLLIIFLILYLQFKRISTTFFVFSSIAVAFSGGFILLWLYSQDWFLYLPFFGDGLRHVFNVQDYNLSVAVWVGFLALFGIASDDGVVMATYLKQSFKERTVTTVEDIRHAALVAAQRRLKPCLMTTATTILALLPILTSTGRGADIMIPMALPSVGGMMVSVITLFVVPVSYAWREERRLALRHNTADDKLGSSL